MTGRILRGQHARGAAPPPRAKIDDAARNGDGSPPVPESDRARVGRPRRHLLVPVGFIVVALVALVVVPHLVRGRIDRLAAQRTEVVEPARERTDALQLSLVRQMGALRGFVLTEDEVYVGRFQAALETERRALRELAPLVQRMSPEVEEAFAELGRRASRWHDRVTEGEVLGGTFAPADFTERIGTEDFLYQDALDAVVELRDRLNVEGRRIRDEIRKVERISLAVTGLLALLALGAAGGALTLGRSLRTYAADAERRRAYAERVSENRARLIRGITHDLKNPLGAARGHLALVRDGIVTDPEPRERSLEHADRALVRTLEIIDDLLELSRAEAGELQLTRCPTDLEALVREAVEDHRDAAARAGLLLAIESADEGTVVETDERRVREIVRNLVSNAVKYTPEGGTVTVRTSVRTESPDEATAFVRPGEDHGRPQGGHSPNEGNPRSWIVVEVEDTGPGIAPEEQERIFHEFARIDRGGDAAGGTGLGLAISRQVARLLGGDVDVESEVGRGSTFILRIPVDGAGAARNTTRRGGRRRRSPDPTAA